MVLCILVMLCTVELTNQVVLSFIKESVSHDGTLYVPALQEDYVQILDASFSNTVSWKYVLCCILIPCVIIVFNRLSVSLRITVYKWKSLKFVNNGKVSILIRSVISTNDLTLTVLSN